MANRLLHNRGVPYGIVPHTELVWWERLVERITGWTRMGQLEAYDDRWWGHDIHRGDG